MEIIPAVKTQESVLFDLIKGHREENPIRRESLVKQMNAKGYGLGDRAMRNLVTRLRKMGYLICSTPYGGYYVAATMREYDDFKRREYKAKILDMAETMRAMDRAAVDQFGEQTQLELFYI